MGGDVSYSYEQVSEAINKACNEINDAAQLSETGIIDALNLLVTATLVYLAKPGATLLDAAADYELDYLSYDPADPDNPREEDETQEEFVNRVKLEEIIGWIA